MSAKPRDNLKTMRFEGELLPAWSQLLDLAASLCPVPNDTRAWFCRFTVSSGVDDARIVQRHTELLRASIQEEKKSIAVELQRDRDDAQPAQIIGAWMYTLDTLLQQVRMKKTCSWIVEGTEQTHQDGAEGGDISLRRI